MRWLLIKRHVIPTPQHSFWTKDVSLLGKYMYIQQLKSPNFVIVLNLCKSKLQTNIPQIRPPRGLRLLGKSPFLAFCSFHKKWKSDLFRKFKRYSHNKLRRPLPVTVYSWRKEISVWMNLKKHNSETYFWMQQFHDLRRLENAMSRRGSYGLDHCTFLQEPLNLSLATSCWNYILHMSSVWLVL